VWVERFSGEPGPRTGSTSNSRLRILSVEGGGILDAFTAGALAEMERGTEPVSE
jgi:hypothetical protein